MNPMLTLDVVKFELARSMTFGRGAIWMILVLFPVSLVAALRFLGGPSEPEVWSGILYGLVAEVTCLLGLLLWATPVISTEIEGQTWIYLAMRQSGRSYVVVGKYITAVLWTLSAAIVSTTLCALIMGSVGGFKVWLVIIALAALSCIAHASLYVLIGALFLRRTMVTAVFYTLLIEYGLSAVPAVANKLTVNYRLRSLYRNWFDTDVLMGVPALEGEATWVHLSVLGLLSVAMLAVAIVRIRRGQFPTQQEG